MSHCSRSTGDLSAFARGKAYFSQEVQSFSTTNRNCGSNTLPTSASKSSPASRHTSPPTLPKPAKPLVGRTLSCSSTRSYERGEALRKRLKSPESGLESSMAHLFTRLKEAEKRVSEQHERALKNAQQRDALERRCEQLQTQLAEAERSKQQKTEQKLTEKQRESVREAETKVRQLQLTVLQLQQQLVSQNCSEDISTDNEKEAQVNVAGLRQHINLLQQEVNIEHQGRCDLETQLADLQDKFLDHCRQLSALQQERDQLYHLLDEQEELGEQQRHGMQQKVVAAKMSASAEVKRMKELYDENNILRSCLAEQESKAYAEVQQQLADQRSTCCSLSKAVESLEVEKQELMEKLATSCAENQQLRKECRDAVEDSRRANVEMRAAQLELESVRLRGELAAEEEEKQRMAAERNAAKAHRLQQEVETLELLVEDAKREQSQLNSRLSDLEDQNQLLEEQAAMADSCQRAVEDITSRCVQVESEKAELEEQLVALQRRTGRRGSAAMPSNGDSSLSYIPLSTTDDVKLDMWRLQQENVQLRQRIYNQLANRTFYEMSQGDDVSDGSSTSSVHTVIFTGKEMAERDPVDLPQPTSPILSMNSMNSTLPECKEVVESARSTRNIEATIDSEMEEAKRLARRLLSNPSQLSQVGRSELEETAMCLARVHSCLARQLSESLAQLRLSRDDLQKNQRALVRTLSEKRQPQSRPKVTIRQPQSPSYDGDEEDSSTPSLNIISQEEYDKTVSTLSEQIAQLRLVAEGEQHAKLQVERTFIMHQKREQETQRMLQEEINYLRHLNIDLAAEKAQAASTAVDILQLIKKAQEDELALQKIDELRSMVQDLHLARLQKEQKVSALEWKLMDAQANIVLLQAERDSLQRQLDQAVLAVNSTGLSLNSSSNGARTKTHYGEASSSPSIFLDNAYLPRVSRTGSRASQDTVIAVDDSTSGYDSAATTPRAVSSRLSVHSHSLLYKSNSVPGLTSSDADRPTNVHQPQHFGHPVARRSSSVQSGLQSTAPSAGSSILVTSSSRSSNKPRSHSVPVEPPDTTSLPSGQLEAVEAKISEQARAVTDGLEQLIKSDDEQARSGSAVGLTHAMAQRRIEAAQLKSQATHSTTWTVRVYANDASSSGNFSNAMVCKPQHNGQTTPAEIEPVQRQKRTSTRRHKRNASEGSASLLILHRGANAVRDDEDAAKDNTWRKLCRDFALPKDGKPPRSSHGFSPSAQGSAFRNWAEVTKRLEQLVPSQALDAVGSDVTLQSTSSQSSNALSTSTNCSSPQSMDSVAEFFPNFPKASFRPFANGARSASPATSSVSRSTNASPGLNAPVKDSDDAMNAGFALPTLFPAPKIVPVQLLDITGNGSRQLFGGGSPCHDSEHVFRPVTTSDNTDAESVTSYDTVIGPADWKVSEKPATQQVTRKRSHSDAAIMQTRIDLESTGSLSKTPPRSTHRSVHSSVEHLCEGGTRSSSPHCKEDGRNSVFAENGKGDNSGNQSAAESSASKQRSRWDFIFRRSSGSTSESALRSVRRDHTSHESESFGRTIYHGSIAHDSKQQNQLIHEFRTRSLPLARPADSTQHEPHSKNQQGAKTHHSPSPPAVSSSSSKGALAKPGKLPSSKPTSKPESSVPSRASHSPVTVEENNAGQPVSTSPGLPATDGITAIISPTSRSSSVSKKRSHLHRHSVSEMQHRRPFVPKKKREETSKGTRC